MSHKYERKRERGQGLLEFAMVLPLLLLVFAGIAEFGRIFAIYSNLFNAAREGVRYGIVNPQDMNGIVNTATEKILLVDPANVDLTVRYDSGPNTPIKDSTVAQVGDRVIVHLYYDVEPMLPILQPLLRNLYVETTAARTISRVSSGMPTSLPTAFPTSAIGTTTPGATILPEGPTPTNTPTSPAEAPIQINIPLRQGDTMVLGSAEPGKTVTLRDIQNPALRLSTTVDGSGGFLFRVHPALVAGHVIVVEGYGKNDWAIVEGAATPTPTPTLTPTLTPTPSGQYIVISPICGPRGVNNITVDGYQWQEIQGEKLAVYWEADKKVDNISLTGGSFSVQFAVDVPADGTYTVKAEWSKSTGIYAAQTFVVPCPSTPTPTPTATPSFPNLIVESVTLVNSPPISTQDELTFTVSVRNVGDTAANNLFWVDLYVDPTNPISPTSPLSEDSSDWAAVSSLEASTSITLTLNYQAGFQATGDHVAYVLADTWDQIPEDNELDNVGGPVTFTVSVNGPTPTPTFTPTPATVVNGAISGSTWLYLHGDIVPQGRVNVYCYDGSTLIAETLSDENGDYVLTDVPPGTYTVIGEAVINDTLYTDIVMNVEVLSGQTTPYVTLTLH